MFICYSTAFSNAARMRCIVGAGCGIRQGLKVVETRGVVRLTQNDRERALKVPLLMMFHQIDI